MNFQYLGVDAFADFDSKTCASPVCSCFSPRHLNTPEVKSHPYSYLWLAGLVPYGPHRDWPQQLCPLYILDREAVSQHHSQHYDMVRALQCSIRVKIS